MPRSQGFYDRQDELFLDDNNPVLVSLLSSLKFRSTYKKAHGHYPESDELKALIKETNLHFVIAMREVYNRTYAQFRQMNVGMMYAPDGYGFVYGDSPVLFINATKDGWLLGFKEGAKWGKGYAPQFIWPVSRKVLILLEWDDTKIFVIRQESCIRLNRMQWRV